MGPLLALVCPCCFRENVIVMSHAKLFLFLCSVDDFLPKNETVFFFFFFFEIKFQMALIEKRATFDLLFKFFSHHWKDAKFPSAHISLTYIHTRILLNLLTFLPYQFCTYYEFIMYGFSLACLVWLLVLILFHTILEQTINNKMVRKI